MPGKRKKPPQDSATARVHSSAAVELRSPRADYRVVGVGASAGGIEAVSELLRRLPQNPGMAFVIVLHLDPHHESALTSIFSRSTAMPVSEARNNTRIEPDNVYVAPSNRQIEIKPGRRLRTLPRGDGDYDRLPIDRFFRTLAENEGPRAVGIVLSGNGSDGTLGAGAIKAAGGITFAQSEGSAKFISMPTQAAAAGNIDHVLSPAEIASEMLRLSRAQGGPKEQRSSTEQRAFDEILASLRHSTSVDFTQYKHATLRRRIERRMMIHKLQSLRGYADYLRKHPSEAKALFNDVLIPVTGFFRDPQVFNILKRRVFPRLLRAKGAEDGLRVWIPGCSTGEEVYSIAIILNELNLEKSRRLVQIFGTDINEGSLERARAGIFPERIQSEVSTERLRRYFTRCDDGYRVIKAIRDMCIFARQNLTVDPPFSNLDLVSCRNVLIYLASTLQRRIFPTFHYALRQNGLLMLGASETVGGYSDLFALADKKAKVYVKKAIHNRPSVSFANSMPAPAAQREGQSPARSALLAPPSLHDIQKLADRIVLGGFGPAGVIINKDFEVLQFRGKTAPFLEHPHGEASLNLFRMAREGLLFDLRTAINKAVKQNARVRHENAHVRQEGHHVDCAINVVPFTVPPTTEQFYLVLFEANLRTVAAEPLKAPRARAAGAGSRDGAHISLLQDELASMRESKQAIVQEHEATNEELRSANEEIMSSNEELQSTNEELETAKEELQSTNEELTTLNDELESRNSELQQVNNDLHNLLASVSIPVLILNSDLRIRRFTAAAEKMFKLIPGDIGRPITDINVPLDIPNLGREVLDVLDSLAPKDIEVRDRTGHLWSVRIRAYKTMENKIDGVVLALVDIAGIKAAERPAG